MAAENLDVELVLKLLDYPAYFELMNLPLPTNKNGIIEKLTNEKLIIKKGAIYAITNLGAVLFAKQLRNCSRIISTFVQNQNNGNRSYFTK